LEEATRVPLVLSFPKRIPFQKVINTPVSHIDMYATIMDYLGMPPGLDRSDGQSLRRYIDNKSWNQRYDEQYAVSELDKRIPVTAFKFNTPLDSIPNFMIRHGRYKLIIPRTAESDVLDMLYDLKSDPGETNNLIGKNGMEATGEVIGKAEHMRCLLLEWLERMDNNQGFYSNNAFNLNQGGGDIEEVRQRRKWRKMPMWISEMTIVFGTPVLVAGKWRQNQYLYIGRSRPGKLEIHSIYITGKSKDYISVDKTQATVVVNGYIRIKVSFVSRTRPTDLSEVNAQLRIRHSLSDEPVIIKVAASADPIEVLKVSANTSTSSSSLSRLKTADIDSNNDGDKGNDTVGGKAALVSSETVLLVSGERADASIP